MVAPATSARRMERECLAKQSAALRFGALICASWTARPSFNRTVSPSSTDDTARFAGAVVEGGSLVLVEAVLVGFEGGPDTALCGVGLPDDPTAETAISSVMTA